MAKQKYQIGLNVRGTGLDFLSRQLLSLGDAKVVAREMYTSGHDVDVYPTTLKRTRKRQTPVPFWK